LALEHPIFNTPNKVRFPIAATQERGINQAGYTSPLYPNGMGETYSLVDFESGAPDGWNPTLVSHEGFFTDVPGFENLAEGQSAKMLGSLSLARQGRTFYWGYSIDPSQLTDPAKDTLENVLRYMVTKRDAKTTRYTCNTRKSLWIYLALNKESGYKRGIEEHFLGTVKPDSRKTYEPTPEGLQTWLDQYLPYVFSGKDASHKSERYKTVFEVDFDAKQLQTPNASRASLETWLKLANGEDQLGKEIALRLLDRYVHEDIAPRDWSGADEWYAKVKDRIVFVESAGFWWIEDPSLPPVK
jgi:hypothetical protein